MIRRCFSSRYGLTSLMALTVALLIGRAADAHMAWLGSTPEGEVIFWFGESTEDRTYHLPERIAKIAIRKSSSSSPIAMSTVETDDLHGLKSDKAIGKADEYFGTATYGLYHGMKLTYHVEHLPQSSPADWPTVVRDDAKLQTVIRGETADSISVTVLADGKPLENTKVSLYGAHGEVKATADTDGKGQVKFSADKMTQGLNAVLVGVTTKNIEGELDGESYQSTADYLTSTFYFEGTDAGPKTERVMDRPTEESSVKAELKSSGLADLPEELTSFGAAYCDGKIYVYGGHTGEAHSYSIDEQSDRLWSLDLTDNDAQWTKLASGPRLQGLALVPYKDSLIRIGGFTAMNKTGDEHKLVSQTSVAKFDPASGKWSDLPALPEPRSSFDAAVMGDKVYVIGGWKLDGTEEGQQWHQSAYSLDLSDSNAQWQALQQPPFQRRALSVAAFDGKIYAVGGMRSERGPTTEVSVYDAANDKWSEGPSIPGGGMSGFGSSSFACSGHLFVTSMDGGLHMLSADGDAWETLTTTDPARFFHRMIPIAKDQMLMIGGANMEIGKFTEVQTIQLSGL
ncbi:hypothetical protein LOC67_24080 [Stieleria sp. JC731]|uniref:Kelch repeat-containing protein n=1 Tax=Pirellulaceae TaxID=2691357 RepID=UPI001E60BE6F|nr:hypothetical protein [Stieleria sp. JC731]MCC9603639.1 hypothetical protein [Stieleria sp. JC731]